MDSKKSSNQKFATAKVAAAFNAYPQRLKAKLLFLRRLILETAEETDGVDKLEETLQWSEPAYLAKKGSTIRLAGKKLIRTSLRYILTTRRH